MPYEYWLDAGKKSRQYYLKQKIGKEYEIPDMPNKQTETSGEQVWREEGNNEYFLWVENDFS